MRLLPVILKLRLAGTSFQNRIAGAAEFALAQRNVLNDEMAFVLPLAEDCESNRNDGGLVQKLTERIGVATAIRNDSTQSDKLGIRAYDRLEEVRTEIWHAILGWEVPGFETVLEYRGGRILGIDRPYLWYLFEFEAKKHLVDGPGGNGIKPDDYPNAVGVYVNPDGEPPFYTGPLGDGVPPGPTPDLVGGNPDGTLATFDEIYAQYFLAPNSNIPLQGPAGIPPTLPTAIADPDMSQLITLVEE